MAARVNRGWRAALIGTVGLLLGAGRPAVAQRPSAVRVSTDNDAFLFWRPPWERTDHEYTGGARGTLTWTGAARLLPLGALRPACATTGGDGCASHSYALGQELYTGEPPPTPGVAPDPHPSHRTNAAWLYVEAAERDSAGADVTAFAIRVGVVGPPALGEPMQQFFHVIGPRYPLPVDWRKQLPFEPGFIVTAARTHVLATLGDLARSGAALSARGSASLGTILMGAEAGVTALAATRLGERDGAWPRVIVRGDAALHGVARDEFLDGTLFRPSPRLAKNPAYAEFGGALELRWSRLGVSYRVTRTGERYRLQDAPTLWGTLAAEWRP
ncbi:MAG TPA: lipid A-modifier LpxR family protein [Gemmatimonadaceae bacterium]|nr:lipid A-modifier LpxR family protein [Gemmatimonadaceae bacterium]